MERKLPKKVIMWDEKVWAVQIGKTERIRFEQAIARYMTKTIKDTTGRGPQCIEVKIKADIIDITVSGYLTELHRFLISDLENIPIVEQIWKACEKKLQGKVIKEIGEILEQDVDFLYIKRDILHDRVRMALIIK